MGYDELMNAPHRETMPLGSFIRRQVDRKYRNVLELNPRLSESLVFCECLRRDLELTSAITHRGQLHYEICTDEKGIPTSLEIEQGNFQTLSQLFDSNPAVVANEGYVDNTVNVLFDLTAALHERQIYHLCFAPQNIFVRKGDQVPMLLCHGSSFMPLSSQADFYQGFEKFVAPEVLEGQTADERSDVYSLGRLIEWLYSQADMPYEYKAVVARAVREQPEKRFASIADMQAALNNRRGMKRSLFTFVAAVVVVVFAVGLYFELMPQTEDIEFVDVPKEEEEDFLDKGFNMETELGLWVDSVDTLSDAERHQMEVYMRKAEDIFRRQYRQKADRIMQKVYTKEGMSLSENVFIATTSQMTKELTELQQQLAGDAGISEDVAVKIAAEINDELAAEKQKNLQLNGYQKTPSKDE